MSKEVEPGARAAFRFAFAAGGVLANLCLITLYALLGLRGGSPGDGTLLGSAFIWARFASPKERTG